MSEARRYADLNVNFADQPEWPPDRPWIHTLSWSPDGNHILFSCDSGICVVDLEGNLVGESPLSVLWPVGGISQGQYSVNVDKPVAAWSPDGSRIAVRSNGVTSGIILYTMNPDGSGVHPLYAPIRPTPLPSN